MVGDGSGMSFGGKIQNTKAEDFMTNRQKYLIRNSAAEFLIFTSQSGDQSIETRYENETIWLSQKLMAVLFQVTISTINEHLKNIYEEGELTREATICISPFMGAPQPN
jgi:hypothetical protein